MNTPRLLPGLGLRTLGTLLLPLVSTAALAQDPCIIPATERPAQVGCYFTAAESLGAAPAQELFWHLYTYPSHAAAAQARQSRGIVVSAFGRVWLYTIAPRGWHPSSGQRIAVVGPLSVEAGTPYVARYMEAVFLPGMRTRVHRHSGPEAWYVLTGSQCLETPQGITVVHAGQSAVVETGPPMVLSTVGRETRRAVLLVLHDASQPWTTMDEAWQAKGRCPP